MKYEVYTESRAGYPLYFNTNGENVRFEPHVATELTEEQAKTVQELFKDTYIISELDHKYKFPNELDSYTEDEVYMVRRIIIQEEYNKYGKCIRNSRQDQLFTAKQFEEYLDSENVPSYSINASKIRHWNLGEHGCY